MKKIIYTILIILMLGLKIMAQDFYGNIKEWKMENGIDVITYNKPTSNICAINIGFKLPISIENEKNVGLRNLLIKVMTRNTKDYNAFELSKAIEEIGASVSPVVSKDYIGISSISLCKYTPQLLNILKEILYNPSFDGFEEEKNIAVQQASMMKSIWAEVSDLWIYKTLKTQYRFKTIGYPETISNINKSDIISLYNKYFSGNNMVVVLSGNLDVINNLENELQKLNVDLGVKQTLLSPLESPLKDNTYIENRKVDSSAFVIGLDAPNIGTDDYLKWRTFSTYLYNKVDDVIRQKNGLAYSATSFMMNMFSNSYLFVRSDINDPSRINEAIKLAEGYLARNSIENISEKDFMLAKNMVVGSLSRANQTSSEIAADILTNYLYKLPLNYTSILLEKSKDINKGDITSLAPIISKQKRSIVQIITSNR
jgi:zinc protease